MAFTAGISRPKTNNFSGNQQKKFDRLLTVLNYDTSKATLYGEDNDGIKYEVIVDPELVIKIDKNSKQDAGKASYLSHKIDDKMKKEMPVGSKVVVSRSTILSKDNGAGYKKAQVERVNKVGNPEPNKTFEGLFTLTYRTHEGFKKVAHIQHWQEKGIDINDDSSLQELAKKINAQAQLYGTKVGDRIVNIPTYGVKFRALQKSDRNNDLGPIYIQVDSSIPFDWIRTSDEDGNSKGHPLTGDEMLSIAEQYIEHISNHEGFKDNIENMKIEVVPYQNYMASDNKNMELTFGNPERDKNAWRNPLYQFSHRESFVDMEHSDDGRLIGKNNAVKGIIQLSDDKIEKINGKLEEIPVNFVSRLYANGVDGHVDAFVRTSDGNKVELHDSLKLIANNYYQKADNAVNQVPSNQNSQRNVDPAPVATPAPVPDNAKNANFDPFGDDMEMDSSAPEPVAEKKGLRFGSR